MGDLVLSDIIPAELQALTQWVTWSRVTRGEKQTKEPFIAGTGTHASSTDPQTWRDFATARNATSLTGEAGIGFVLQPPHLGIDLDHMCDGTRAMHADAIEILSHFSGAYVEFSPSGTGLRLFARGTVGTGRNWRREDGTGWEIYDHGRFLTVTGSVVPGYVCATPLPDCQEGIDWFLAAFPPASGGHSASRASSGVWGDMDIVLRDGGGPAQKLHTLAQSNPQWTPTWTRKRKMPGTSQSMSEYDMALACMMAYAAWSDQEICDTLRHFRAQFGDTSKDGRLDYYQRTIYNARELVRRDDVLDSLEDTKGPEALASLQYLLHLDVVRYVQTGRDPAAYRVYLADDTCYFLGDAKKARSQSQWQNISQEHNGVPFESVSAKQWHQVVSCLGLIVEREDATESTTAHDMVHSLQLYANQCVQDADYGVVRAGKPFLGDGGSGSVHVNLLHFQQWLAVSHLPSCAGSEARTVLRSLGAESIQIHRREDTKDVNKMYWKIRLDSG